MILLEVDRFQGKIRGWQSYHNTQAERSTREHINGLCSKRATREFRFESLPNKEEENYI